VGVTLSEENKRQLWIPEGFAHGFVVVSDVAEFLYKTTDYWQSKSERAIIWDDADLLIQWPSHFKIMLSEKDILASNFKLADKFK
jgi:dTDP-4-dehydrorhamnose 3,5-epimerase